MTTTGDLEKFIEEKFDKLMRPYIEKMNNIETFVNNVDMTIDLIYKDPHRWGLAKCTTCETITRLLAKQFGCIKLQAERQVNPKPV